MGRSEAKSTLGRGSAHTLPWLTFALVGVCICVFSMTQWSSRQAQATAESELQAAIDYLIAHPYLEPGPILETRIDPTLLEQQARMRRSAPPIPKRVQRREKTRLDELVSNAYVGVAELPSQRWGFRASDFSAPTLVSHFFLHERPMHLLCALGLVLLLGFHLEIAWGSRLYAAFVPLAAITAAVVFGGGNRGFETPYIGLSGLVAAMLAAFIQSHRSVWKQPVYPFLLISGALFLVLPIRFGDDWSLASGLELTRVLTVNQGAGYWAIAGGFVFGSFWQFIASQLQAGDHEDSGDASGDGQIASPLLEEAINAQSAGRMGDAHAAISRLLAESPDHHDALLVMWDVALERDDVEQASAAMIRAIRGEVKRGDTVAAVDHWLDLVNRGCTDRAEPALLIRLSLMLEQRDQRFAAVEALQLALDRSDGGNEAVIATRVARASRGLDTEMARAAAWRALGSMDLDIEERQSLEGMLEDIGSGIEPTAIGAQAGGAPGWEIDVAPEREQHAEGANHEPQRPRQEAWVDPLLSEGGEAPEEVPGAEVETVELTDLVAIAAPELASVEIEAPPLEFESPVGDVEPLSSTSAVAGTASAPANSEALPNVRAPEAPLDGPAAIDLDVVSRSIRSVAAVPLEFADGGLRLEVARGRKRRVLLSKVGAISVAAVGGLGSKPVILIDLVMNWHAPVDGILKVIRMRGDQFDARPFVSDADSAIEGLRAFAAELLRVSGAIALPDARSAVGTPFASYDSLDAYQSAVLNVDEV